MEQDIRRNSSKPPYIGLHLNQQRREPVYLKNGGINVILFKKFLWFINSVTTTSVRRIFERGRGGGAGNLRIMKTKRKRSSLNLARFLPTFPAQIPKGGGA